MGKWLIPNFVPGYSALVSDHGYFYINRGEEPASYRPSLYESLGVYRFDSGEKVRCETPDFVANGTLTDLGIPHDYAGIVSEFDKMDFIVERLREWWERYGES